MSEPTTIPDGITSEIDRLIKLFPIDIRLDPLDISANVGIRVRREWHDILNAGVTREYWNKIFPETDFLEARHAQ